MIRGLLTFALAAGVAVAFGFMTMCGPRYSGERTFERTLPGGRAYRVEAWREDVAYGDAMICRVFLQQRSNELVGEFRAPDSPSFDTRCGMEDPVTLHEAAGETLLATGRGQFFHKRQGRWSAWSPWQTNAPHFVRQYLPRGVTWDGRFRGAPARFTESKWIIEMELATTPAPKLVFVDFAFDEERSRQANAAIPAHAFPADAVIEFALTAGEPAKQTRSVPLDGSEQWRRVDLAETFFVRGRHGTEDPNTAVIEVRWIGSRPGPHTVVLTNEWTTLSNPGPSYSAILFSVPARLLLRPAAHKTLLNSTPYPRN